MTTSTTKYFDDLQIGERFVTEARTVTLADVETWVTLLGAPGEMFTDYEYASQKSVFGRPVVPAFMVQAFADALLGQQQTLVESTVALLGSHMRALAPLFVGDTMHVEVEISGKKRSSKPDRGVVTLLYTMSNQDGQAIMSANSTVMMWRRPDLVLTEG